MYSLQMSQKKQRDQIMKLKKADKIKKWFMRYNSEVKPKLLQHYDSRVNAFIRQIQQAPEDPKVVMKKPASSEKHLAFRFKITEHTNTIFGSAQTFGDKKQNSSICRSSAYIPISSYQYREREKQKQIKPKPTLKTILYKKWQKQRQIMLHNNIKQKQQNKTNRLSVREGKKISDDNRSQINSINQESQSMRYSVHNQNLEREARQYQKKQQLVEKKSHFKRLASLQQIVEDQKAKRSLHSLLVKGGATRPKLRTQYQQAEVDLLKLVLEKTSRM